MRRAGFSHRIALIGVALAFSATARAAVITVLDVGQGSAVHIETVAGNFLIDTGPANMVNRVIDHFADNAIARIDAIILTSADADHAGGLARILEQVPVSHVVWNDVSPADPQERDALGHIRFETPFDAVRGTETIVLGENMYALLLPSASTWPDSRESSLAVLVYRAGNRHRLLFAGDAGPERQIELARQIGPKNGIRWMLWPDHGGPLAPSFAGLLTDLRQAAVSVGPNDQGLPSADVDTLAKKGVRVLRTDNDGTLVYDLGRDVQLVSPR